ncbi:MAG: hypothetical protein RL701_2058 [Pseudomonadota bacterium]|jgi:hypothetical protein
MHDTRWRTIFWLLCLAACSSSDDDADVAISTGLPASQQLSTLDDHAVQDACRSIQTGIMDLISTSELTRAECASNAIADASTGAVAECEQQTAACAADPKAHGVTPATLAEAQEGCSSASADTLAGCEATVSEYEACVNRLVLALRDRLHQVTCQVAANRAQSGAFAATSIPECKTFLTQCPDAKLGVPTTIDD